MATLGSLNNIQSTKLGAFNNVSNTKIAAISNVQMEPPAPPSLYEIDIRPAGVGSYGGNVYSQWNGSSFSISSIDVSCSIGGSWYTEFDTTPPLTISFDLYTNSGGEGVTPSIGIGTIGTPTGDTRISFRAPDGFEYASLFIEDLTH